MSFSKTYQITIVFTLSLSILCFSIWGAKIGIIPCIFTILFFLKTNVINKKIVLKDLYPIRWWIFVNLGIIAMAFVSLFFCFDIIQTIKTIVFFLITPLSIALIFFIVFKHSNNKVQNIGLIFIFSIFILHSIFTALNFVLYNNPRSVGIGNHPIIPYTLFLLIPLSLSLSLFIYSRFKLIALIVCIISLFALYANGTRASLLSIACMSIGMILYPEYNNKKNVTLLFVIFIVFFGWIFLEWSARQDTRINFKHMIEKFSVVWSYSSSEMGRFDQKCFAKTTIYQCRPESGNMLDTHFIFESNALQRLSLNKMGYNAIKDNPFRPNGFFPLFFDLNLPENIAEKDFFYFQNHDGLRFYQHIQNGFLSAFFELGIIGGILYVASFGILIILSLKCRNLYGFLLFNWIVGVIPQNLLDVPFAYGGITLVSYAIIGILLGKIFGEKDENYF